MAAGVTLPTPPERALRSAATVVIAEGVVLALLGVGALILPVLAGLAAAIFVGWVLIAAGIMGVVAAFTTHPHIHFWWSLLAGVISIIAGVVAVFFPPAAIEGLIILVAAWLAVDGANSAMLGIELRRTHSGQVVWLWITAIVDWLLAAFLLFLWMPADAVALGVIVGVDLILAGCALIGMGASLRRKAV